MPSTRKIRITRRWRKLAYGADTTVPEIRLVGKWLAQAGFAAGAAVRVEHTGAGVLVLRAA